MKNLMIRLKEVRNELSQTSVNLNAVCNELMTILITVSKLQEEFDRGFGENVMNDIESAINVQHAITD